MLPSSQLNPSTKPQTTSLLALITSAEDVADVADAAAIAAEAMESFVVDADAVVFVARTMAMPARTVITARTVASFVVEEVDVATFAEVGGLRVSGRMVTETLLMGERRRTIWVAKRVQRFSLRGKGTWVIACQR